MTADAETWVVAQALRGGGRTHHVVALLVDDVPARTTQARMRSALEAAGRITGAGGIPWANTITRPLKQVKGAEQLERAEHVAWRDLEAFLDDVKAGEELLDRRIVVRVTAADHGRMALAAKGENVSLQVWTLNALRAAVDASAGRVSDGSR